MTASPLFTYTINMGSKKRRRVTPSANIEQISEQEQAVLKEDAFDRLACVSKRQFDDWSENLWESPKHPTTVEELLFVFCGDCTARYENMQRQLGQCNRDEWDAIDGFAYDIEKMRESDG